MRYLIFLFAFFFVLPANAGENIISPTIGHVNWDNTVYTVQGQSFHIQQDDNAGGVSYRYQFDSGFIAGADLFYINGFEFDAEDNSFNGHGNSFHAISSVGYTFNHTGQVQFFLDAGIGGGYVSIHSGSGPNASLNGVDLQYNLGMNVFFNHRIGMRAAYKKVDFDLEDDNGGDMDGQLELYSIALNIRF